MVTTNDEGRQYNLGQWHQVTVTRDGIDGILKVTAGSRVALGIIRVLATKKARFDIHVHYAISMLASVELRAAERVELRKPN